MKVSVSHMTTDASDQATASDVVMCFLDDVGESADRNGLKMSIEVFRSGLEILTTSVVQT